MNNLRITHNHETQHQELLALFHKAASDHSRLSILRILCSGSFGVLELSEIVQIKQTALSHHLKVLVNSELVATKRDGNSLFYYLTTPAKNHTLHDSARTLVATLRQENLPSSQIEAITQIKSRRAARSVAFFEKNAKKFDKFQERVAMHSQYCDVAESLLKPMLPQAFAIEFGPGHGAFLPWLSTHANQVLAVDKSEAMLEECQKTLTREKINNVSLSMGDTKTARQQHFSTRKPDAVIANMVLHHVPEPAEFIEDIAHTLADDGILVITELRQHQQAWTRDVCGDIWLGFTPQDFTEWAHSAKLDLEESMFRGLRNGFEVIGVRFRKPKCQEPSC